MSDQSFAGLCARLQGKSITRGWDAIVTMDRTKVNRLLEQQYVSKFRVAAIPKKIFGEVKITSDEYSILEFTALVLGPPRLSFENASLANSRARLTMDVESGTVSQRLDAPGYPPRLTESFTVTPQQGFQVYMDIDLVASTGIVEEQGRVFIDLGNAFNFGSNLVAENSPAQLALGEFFKREYLSLPVEARVYELGKLNFSDDDLLTPREFEIRTQQAPPDNALLSEGGLGGAVVLFIRTKNNPTNGSTPVDGSNFEYLIPDDVDPVTGKAIYSGALVLASRVVFDWYVEPYVMEKISNGLRFERVSQSNDTARLLRAVSGEFPIEDVYYQWESGVFGKGFVKNTTPLSVKLSGGGADTALCVSPVDAMLSYEWSGNQPYQFYVYKDMFLPGTDPKEDWVDSPIAPTVHVKMKPSVDLASNVVWFETQEAYVVDIYERIYADLRPYIAQNFAALIANRLFSSKEIIKQALRGIEAPEINVFHLNHLLFPEQNALLLTEAALPGDLFLVGHIDPQVTEFTLEPLFGRVKAGLTLQLEVKHFSLRNSSVTWSAHTIEGKEVPEVISQTGLFTAPAISQIKDLAERYIVTASYEADDGTLRIASAQVTVVVESLTVTPSIATLQFSEQKPVELNAISLGTGSLTWTRRGDFGELLPDGNSATYRLPKDAPEEMSGLVVIDVEDRATGEKASASILWLRGTFAMTVKPGYHPGLPAGASTQLQASGYNPDDITWEVLAGEGQVTAEGLYTAPDIIQSPYEVIVATYRLGALKRQGYSIVHLSNFARASNWIELKSILLTSNSAAPMVYSNGLQQVNVSVSVEPRDVGDEKVDVSDEEMNSIQLLFKDENNVWQPLSRVGKSGVPEGGAWGYGVEKYDDYDQYPAPPEFKGIDNPSATGVKTAQFYVQSRAIGKLEIAASLRGDDGITYRSNAVGDATDPRTITLSAVEPPNFETSVYSFAIERMEGKDEPEDENQDGENDGNDKDLTTVDYYRLTLKLGNLDIDIKNVEFEAAKSMVQWESRQFDEDICSFTGYAFAGSRILNFDPLLYARMPESIRPKKEVAPGYHFPEGSFLLSLHRCEYWHFDLACEPDYTSGLKLIIHDTYGNRHRVRINFKSPSNRNSLTTTKI